MNGFWQTGSFSWKEDEDTQPSDYMKTAKCNFKNNLTQIMAQYLFTEFKYVFDL